MKKLFAFILCIAALMLICTIATSAMVNKDGHYTEEGAKIDEIMAGEAGEKTVLWEVPFLHIAPKLDGVIDRNEYIPFEMYEDYLSWLANSGVDGVTEEDFNTFYEGSQENFVKPYWGWDGTYMYLAFEVNLINGFACTPEAMGGEVYLWAYNCLQVGFAAADATGTKDYVELGYGVHSETNESLTFNWFGTYLPKPNEDFVGYYDQENQVLRYEIRVHLQTVLGLTDRTVENGDTMNYAWVLSTNGEAETPNDYWHLMFARGISGPGSKDVSKFALVTFTGKPDGLEIKPVEIPGMSAEDKEYMLMEVIDMADEAVVKTFEGENAAVDYITEGDMSFMRITSLTADGYAYASSSKYPRNIVGTRGDYVVIRYRTSSAKGEDLGLSYRTTASPEYDLDMCYYDSVGADGEWHTVIFYMTGEPYWDGAYNILNLCLIPFYGAEDHAQETFDVAWIKFYQNDPTELYEDDYYNPDAAEGDSTEEATEEATEEVSDEPTIADTAEVTEAPSAEATAEATESSEAETTAPLATETMADSAEAATTGESQTTEQGCQSMTLSLAAVLVAAGAALVLYKKKEF